MMHHEQPSQTTANACVYLLHMLLQRMERLLPGIAEDLLQGAMADQAAFNHSQQQDPAAAATFEQAIALLQRLDAQNQAALQTTKE